MRKVSKRVLQAAAALAIAAAVGAGAGIAILRTDWFRNKVREKIVAAVENATGGRVEIGVFDYSWPNFTADLSALTLHGKEPAGAPPLFHAERVHVRLKLISFWQRKADIVALIVDRPQVHVYVHADGTTNLPTPANASRTQGNVVADILNLRIQHLQLVNGTATYNSEDMPLDVRADDVAAELRYAALPPRYTGKLSANRLHVSARVVQDATFDVSTGVIIENDRIRIQDARLTSNRSTVNVSGSLTDFSSPQADLDVKSRLFLADFAKSMKAPLADRGEVALSGKARVLFAPFRYTFDGLLSGRDLAYMSRDINLPNLALASKIDVTPDAITLTKVDVAALGGHFLGTVRIEDLKRFQVKGTAEGIAIGELAALQGQHAPELNGTATGPVEAQGVMTEKGIEDVKGQATLHIARGQAGVPVEGSVSVAYDQRSGALQLGNSNLTLGTSQVNASGTLGQALAVHMTSRDLHDLIAAMPLVGRKIPANVRAKLAPGGMARFDGTVTGPLNNPAIQGQMQVTSFQIDNYAFNRLSASLDATRSRLDIATITIDGDQLHAAGSGQVTLVNWAPDPQCPVTASITVRDVNISRILSESGWKYPVSGTLTGAAKVTGTYGSPQVTGHVDVAGAVAYEQPFNRVAADLTYHDRRLEVASGRARVGQAEADFSGTYYHSGSDWTSGQLSFNGVTRGFKLAQVQAITKRRQGVDGQVNAEAVGVAHFIRGDFQLDTLDSRLDVRNVVIDGEPTGDVVAAAKTRGQILDVQADAKLRGTDIRGQGEWRLEGDYPGQAQITVPRMQLSTVRDLLPSKGAQDLPFGGFVSASANVAVPLKNLHAIRADATVSELQINSSGNAQPRAGAEAKDLVLRNAEPLRFEITSKSVDVRSARFTGTDTTIQASGRVAFDEKEPWALRVNGSVNLAILQLFNPDLLASGMSTVNATVRGPLKQPDVNGRLELRNASLYFSDLPNGVEKANGVILFDRSRATVERLSGESGGGAVTFQAGSFVGFSGALLIYHVQATADHVRYRSPEGMSITANGNLSLAGTSERSTLAGTVTVARAAFSPQTDVGSLLASFAKPVSVPTTPNAYVRGIQFDVRIDTAQNLEVLTSLTRDIQAEANLRLRGNVDRPILLGEVSVTEGQIDFFGNKYRINRGELNFNNPAKIEPVVDMDLETRVRGITVDITFAGSLNKLSFSYRSDPPLESAQIIALLAVGREPVGLGALANSQATTNTSYLALGTNGILQQAVTAPVSGRLQRFFGVSHIKIDPQLTDITSVPQARLSFEQQISKDITLTYITNLSRTSEQVVRVEWDFSRRWSVVAVRDENGLFGMDLQYRKRFK